MNGILYSHLNKSNTEKGRNFVWKNLSECILNALFTDFFSCQL